MTKHDPRARRDRTAKNYVKAHDWNPSPEEEKEIDRWKSIYRAQPELFAKRHIRVIDRESARGAGIKPFVFNNCQKALHQLRKDIKEFNLERSKAQHKLDRAVEPSEYPLQLVILKPRKVGVSTYLQFLAFHRCEFEENTACLVMAHEAAAAVNIMKISRRFDEQFVNDGAVIPVHLNFRQPIKRKAEMLMEWGSPLKDEEGWGSHIVVKTAGTKVSGTSRSFTWHFVHLSEEAHFSTDSEVPPVMNARAKACETYEESTANGVGGLFYNTWEKALPFEVVRKAYRDGKPLPPWWNGKYQFFWSWLHDPDYRKYVEPYERSDILSSLSAREKELMDQFKATLEQISWRRMKIATECSSQSEIDPELYFNQEYPTTPTDAFVSKGKNVFSTTALSEMKKNNEYTQPVWTGRVSIDSETDACLLVAEPVNDISLKIWAEPKEGADYIMGVDTAEGLKHGDYTVLSIFERCNDDLLREASRFRGKLPPEESAILAVHLAKKYNNAFIVPEANMPGNATCYKIVRMHYPHVYHRDNVERVQNDADMSGFTAGFKTTAQTKPHLVAEGQAAVRKKKIQLIEKAAIDEWMHYKNDDGVFKAPDGENDDCVIADLLCCFGHFTGKAPRLRQKVKLEERTNLGLGPNGLPADVSQAEFIQAVSRFIKKARKKSKRRATREEQSAGTF